MDILALSNDLKNLSDQQLAQVPHTSPYVPPYIVVAEAQRREQARKEYQAQASKAPQGTVAQRLMQKMQGTPPPSGPPQQGQPMQSPQMGAPPTGGIAALAQQQAPAGPQGMAAGGIVALADGGAVPDDQDAITGYSVTPSAVGGIGAQGGMNPAMSVQEYQARYPHTSIEDAMRSVKGVSGQDQLGPLAAELAKLYETQKTKKVNPWEALSQAGFAMAAEPTHSFGRALGVAGLTGIANMQAQKDEQRKQLIDMMQGRIGLAEHQTASQDNQIKNSSGLMRDANAYQDSLANILEASLREQQKLKETEPYRKAQVAKMEAEAAQKELVDVPDDLKGDLGDQATRSDINRARAIKTGGKKAGAPKDAFTSTVSKVAAEQGLPPSALTSVTSLASAITGAKTITAQEKNDALAYLATNTTPGATSQAGVMRMQIMGQNREYPVINKGTGELEMRSAAEINANKGTFAPAGQGATAMGKNAVFQDLHYNIDTARKAINDLESLDAPTRAALSYTLKHTDPRSAMQTFLSGTVGTQLNDKQQEAVQSLALLAENAMSLRSVAGMGQGSDELRAAIQATLPSGKSPSKGYALKQLDKFENVVSRLETGVPGMGKKVAPTTVSGETKPTAGSAPAVIKWGRDKDGNPIQLQQ